jgi:hypothetical protein
MRICRHIRWNCVSRAVADASFVAGDNISISEYMLSSKLIVSRSTAKKLTTQQTANQKKRQLEATREILARSLKKAYSVADEAS